MSTIQKYWRKTVKFGGGDREFSQAPLVTCEDGFHMSVQASRHHYCSPRETLKSGDYRKWEVGFPAWTDPQLLAYGEENDDVFGYVPTEVVDAIIESHGGLLKETQ